MPRPRWTRRRIVWVSVAALVLLWIIAAAAVLAMGVRDASHATAEVNLAKDHLSAADLVSGGPGPQLKAAGAEFTRAKSLLDSPLLAPVDILPVLGRQLRSVQDLAAAAAQVSAIGVTAVTEAKTVLDAPHQAGPDRVTALRRLALLGRLTDAALAKIDPGPSEALIGPVASKHDSFVRQLDQARTKLQNASAVASAVAGILQGPQHYLILMGNNAEMRAGSGAYLEAGLLTTGDGELHLSGVVPTSGIPARPGAVPVTGDLETNWGWLLPGVDWRNLGLTPQFDVNGPLAARMWQSVTGQHVDGVLAVDVDTLHQFLQVTGPVSLPDGTSLNADNVVQYLTHDQYAGLSDTDTSKDRVDRLGAIATASLNALNDQSLDLKSLADAMTSATSGRHLLLWSADPSAESAWQSGGVGGQLSAHSAMVAVLNRGGNKLDQYLSVGSSLRITPGPASATATASAPGSAAGAATHGSLTITLQNQTPPGQSQFIAGPYPGLGTVYGEYVGLLTVNLPPQASHLQVPGGPAVEVRGAEGPVWVLATPVDVHAGATETIVVTFDLPAGHGSLTVVPSARLSPVTWHYRGAVHSDATPFTLSW
ncbi:MAG TPA: DUF4012 domain-containing protein [Acidimicrobiales bacterium]|nr:DUF4012 domain-containing protein [Acidimicrobiales bacterium]